MRKLNCFENRSKDVIQQWIKKDSILKCYEVLKKDDIVSRFDCGSEKTRNFENAVKVMKKIL